MFLYVSCTVLCNYSFDELIAWKALLKGAESEDIIIKLKNYYRIVKKYIKGKVLSTEIAFGLSQAEGLLGKEGHGWRRLRPNDWRRTSHTVISLMPRDSYRAMSRDSESLSLFISFRLNYPSFLRPNEGIRGIGAEINYLIAVLAKNFILTIN